MSFNYLTNETLNIARLNYLNKLKELGFKAETEIIDVQDSFNRYTSKAVYSLINAPHYPSSAMDGIAVKASNTFGASENNPIVLTPDQFVMVDTGDPIPSGKDAVIMIEDVIFDDNKNVKLYKAATLYNNIRQVGEDICAHEMILPANSKITPSAIGAMFAGGVLKVEVYKKIKVGIIPTGDEIVLPTSNPSKGDIIEFNSSIFRGMLIDEGCEVTIYNIVKDKLDEIEKALLKATKENDLVIINAGSSAGRDDYACEAIKNIGEVMYHGIAIKPGKPTILGYKDTTPIIGVPGYPVSGILVVEEIIKPVINMWFGRPTLKETVTATLSRNVISSLKYEEFVRVRLGIVNGKIVATPLNRGAGVVSSFMKADGILTIPQNLEGYKAEEEVEIALLKPLSSLKNTIIIIGSHDPLIDELNDLLHSKNSNLTISSSHVGSMGGIMATKRNENHLGGIHLLDEETGKYNISFVDKYFPDGGVKLIECVGRKQGIMVAKGNPLGIKEFKDLTKSNLRYVNRQKGSGTRILYDYLCKKNNIDPSTIYGNDREEFTHNSVATQIASNDADAGMGIYSVAKVYDLDFIEVADEQYDFLITDEAYQSKAVQELIEVLKSDEFKVRINKLGGYTINNPGKIRYAK